MKFKIYIFLFYPEDAGTLLTHEDEICESIFVVHTDKEEALKMAAEKAEVHPSLIRDYCYVIEHENVGMLPKFSVWSDYL